MSDDAFAAGASNTEMDDVDDVKPRSRTSSSSSFNDEERLFRSLFRHYNNRIRPVRNSSDPVNVALTFSLMQIHHLVSKLSLSLQRQRHNYWRFFSQKFRAVLLFYGRWAENATLVVLPRDATQSAVLPWQVVCLSPVVCLSVTFRYRAMVI